MRAAPHGKIRKRENPQKSPTCHNDPIVACGALLNGNVQQPQQPDVPVR